MNSSPADASTFRSAPMGAERIKPPIWLISCIFLVGLALFVALIGRHEVARWHFASADNALVDGRYEDAISDANVGLKWDPNYHDLIELRARARIENADFAAALEDYDELLAIAAKDEVVNESDMRALSARAGVLQQMRRFEEAGEAMDQVVAFRADEYHQRDDSESKQAYAWSLNNRAYMQAQAQRKLDEALHDIQLAIESYPRKEHAMLDTLGYVQLLAGQPEQALETLNEALTLAATDRTYQTNQLKRMMQQVVDQRPLERQLERIDENYSILLHHRGEAYLANGNEELGNADIEEARRLGYNPEKGIW